MTIATQGSGKVGTISLLLSAPTDQEILTNQMPALNMLPWPFSNRSSQQQTSLVFVFI